MLEYYIVDELRDRLRATKQDLVSQLSQKYGAAQIEQALTNLLESKTVLSWQTNGTTYYTA